MSDSLIVAFATIFSNIITLICGIKLITYRIELLEKKVEKHNQFYDRVNELQKEQDINKIEHDMFNKRITNVERGVNCE